MTVNNNQNTQQPRKKPITIGGYPEAVHDLMRAKYPDYDQVMNGGNGGAAVANGGAGVNFFGNGGGATGKFEAQPVQTGAAPITDFTQMPKQEEFVPQGNGNANPALGPVQTPYMGDAAEDTPQPQSNFEGMPQPSTGWNADGTPRYDTLSTALSGFQMPQEQQVPEFEADPKKGMAAFSVGSARLYRRVDRECVMARLLTNMTAESLPTESVLQPLQMLSVTWETSSTLRRVRLCRCSTTLLP